ncbi:PREDICTED: uncharacterized protein LOC106813069 [Priapulus caudatus]|uniref:Uncharacterized protein LOC106813069 n=1 Tax=Priapulus caudatus TaxID=37621 RepID=A0ABM1EK83_PRICU|nr:PREDICTED: uncharacterized protein LOC106813069 [Priapulus caudatus]
MERIAVDFLGPLPRTGLGHEYILVVCDYFTKWTEVYALSDQTALTTADCLATEWFTRFGTPLQLHSDQGRNFESGLFGETCKLLGNKKMRTTLYHPQSNGLVERFNRTVQEMLSKVVGEHHDDWDDLLPYVMATYRGTVQKSTGCSPNLRLFGREVGLPVDLMIKIPPGTFPPDCPVAYVKWVRKTTEEARAYARAQLGQAVERQKRNYDRRVVPANFKPDTWGENAPARWPLTESEDAGDREDGDHHKGEITVGDIDGDHHGGESTVGDTDCDHHEGEITADREDGDHHEGEIAADREDGNHHEGEIAVDREDGNPREGEITVGDIDGDPHEEKTAITAGVRSPAAEKKLEYGKSRIPDDGDDRRGN